MLQAFTKRLIRQLLAFQKEANKVAADFHAPASYRCFIKAVTVSLKN